MSASPVRWGLLSTATINTELIGPLRASGRSHLLGVASRDEQRAARYAEQHGIERAYGSYEALLGDPEVEAVYVSLPNSLHAEWSRAALEAGKHVLCEKPLTATGAEAEQLFAVAESAGLVLAEAVMYRHHPQTECLRELTCRLGPLRALHASFHYPIPDPDDIRGRPDLAGGALRDVGSYCVSVLNLLAAQDPADVWARVRRPPHGVDMGIAAAIAYPDGLTAFFDASLDSPMSLWLVATGRDGTLRVPNPFQPGRPGLWAPHPCPDQVYLRTAEGEEALTMPSGNPYAHQVEDFARRVRGEDAFVVPPDESVRAMWTIERLLAAAGLSPAHEALH